MANFIRKWWWGIAEDIIKLLTQSKGVKNNSIMLPGLLNVQSPLSFSVSSTKLRTWPKAQRSETAHTMTVSTYPSKGHLEQSEIICQQCIWQRPWPCVQRRRLSKPSLLSSHATTPFKFLPYPLSFMGYIPRALTPVPQSKSNCLWMTTTAHVMVSLDSSCRKWQRPSKESRLSNWRDRGTET